MKNLYAFLLITLHSSLFTLCEAQPGYINTIAGTGATGFNGNNIPATSAEFEFPSGVAVDATGNYYICDQNNERIRKVNFSTGIITTIAGNGAFGFTGDGGPATSAELLDPFVIVVDDSENVYFSDHANNRIRKVVATTGYIYTIAGSANIGFSGDGGPATLAELNSPNGVAIDSSGNIFVVDGSNERIREVYRSSGIINTIAGCDSTGFSGDGGPATSAEFNGVWGVAVDDSDNVYISDGNNNRIRKVIASTGNIYTCAGNGAGSYSGDGGPATSAEIFNSTGLFVDKSYNLYIADFGNERVRMVSGSTGIITTIAGNGVQSFSGDNGPATSAELDFPCDVALDISSNIYIADESNERIRKINSGAVNTGVSTQLTINNSQFTVYPNPAKNTVYVSMYPALGKGSEMMLYSMEGQMILNKTISETTTGIEIQIGNLTNGIYMLRIQTPDGISYLKKLEVMP